MARFEIPLTADDVDSLSAFDPDEWHDATSGGAR